MPRVVDRDERLGEIAAAVGRVLERGGVEQVTMRNVASELGCTTGLLTHWVTDRAALLHVALRATADAQTARAMAALVRDPHDLAGAVEAFLPLDEVRRAEQKVWLGFWALAISDATLRAEQRDRYRDFRVHLVGHLRALGSTPSSARDAADLLMTTADGIAVSATFDPDHWTPSRQRRQVRTVIDAALG
jgi:AcrR family transcriptional regulator